MINFENKIAVITGAANGIGLALAKKAAALKMQLVLADIDQSALKNVEQELQQFNPHIFSCITDVSSEAAVKQLAEQTIAQFGIPQLIINNAGIGGPLGPIWEVSLEQINNTLSVNLMSIIYSLRAFLPWLMQVDTPAQIVNTASMAGFYSAPHLSAYEISKHGVVALTEALYHDLKLRAPHIGVSLLCPGWVNTNIVNNLLNKEGQQGLTELTISDEAMKWLFKFARSVKKGISPEQVSEQVFQAIAEGKFYIFTDPAMKQEIIAAKLESIMHESEPSSFIF